jgi:hypothetical protein
MSSASSSAGQVNVTDSTAASSSSPSPAKQVYFSSKQAPPPPFQLALQEFYEWLVRWRRGLTERKQLEHELGTLVALDQFTWCDSNGHLQNGHQWKNSTLLVYGNAASWLTLSVELENVTLLQSSCSSNDCHLIVAQVWETSCRESVRDESTTAKQVTAWMRKETSPNNNRWTVLHLQETYIQGHEPPPPPTTTTTTTTNTTDTIMTDNVITPPIPPWQTSSSSEPKVSSIPSNRRHVATNLEVYKAKPLLWNGSHLVGISIAGWDIGTSQGPIGDAVWFQQALEELEPLAQYKLLPASTRRLVLPEMVFPLAHVVLDHRKHQGDLFLSWDAMDCLKDWSKCHQAIPMPVVEEQEQEEEEEANTSRNATATTTASSSSVAFRGVSVLQSSDANLWKRNSKDSPSVVGTTEFHYDWTYSTPFFGKFYGTRMRRGSGRGWIPSAKSAMPMQLLTDQSVPILYFDSVILMEDDLHDNGLVQYSIKVRVMPTCAYVLSRLFVRVDQVLIRVRECRLLVDFGAQRLYRDVSWRECAWEDLESHVLPTDIRAWKQEDQETPAFNYMLNKLPATALPKDIPAFAELSYGAGGGADSSSSSSSSTAAAATGASSK